MTTDIIIRGMVCERCVSVIREGITALGYPVDRITLGKVTLENPAGDKDLQTIRSFLLSQGFAPVTGRHIQLITRVKQLIDDMLFLKTIPAPKQRFSTLLADELHMNYDSISAVFTKLEGITLEQYVINRRLEKVIELLVYTDHTLTEIARMTGFSSINHLSRQFRRLTGHAPSHYKAIRKAKSDLSLRQGKRARTDG